MVYKLAVKYVVLEHVKNHFAPWMLASTHVLKVTVDLRGVFWGKQYSALCINGKYINLYIIGELI